MYSLKTQLVYHIRYRTEEADRLLFRYIKVY